MDRLTERNGDSVFILSKVTGWTRSSNWSEPAENAIHRLAAYEDSGLSPEEVQKLKKSDASKEQCTIDQHGEIHRLRDELKRYKQAEQEGRLYNLPLKPGDTIYRPEALRFCWVITKVEIYEDEIVFIDDSDNIFRPDDIGKTVFLTREAAEKVLEVGRMVPKCRECEFNASGYGRILYHICTKMYKPMSMNETKTSPKWCPKRGSGKDDKS